MNAAIVICSHLHSRRVPRKAFVALNGVPLLEHLIRRLSPSPRLIVVAVPNLEAKEYREFCQRFGDRVAVWQGPLDDPLARLHMVAKGLTLDYVVRVNHDKLFVNPGRIERHLQVAQESRLQYVYSSHFVDGTGFEVISATALRRAAERFKAVEHVSYAIRCVTDDVCDLPDVGTRSPHRLLIDYPEDVDVMNRILSAVGNDATLSDALAYLDCHPEIAAINRTPALTVYTCAHDAEPWIDKAMGSVATQHGFGDFEYVLVDDASQDGTQAAMRRFAARYANVNVLWNTENLGLASSSNVALAAARGRYIMRLDADDYLVSPNALQDLVRAISASGYDAMYPDNYMGSMDRIQKGREQHHIGGAIFSTRAVNHIKFTDGLRGLEGYDFFERARARLKIGYYDSPTFFYRQRPDSLSRRDPEIRAALKSAIDLRIAAECPKCGHIVQVPTLALNGQRMRCPRCEATPVLGSPIVTESDLEALR